MAQNTINSQCGQVTITQTPYATAIKQNTVFGVEGDFQIVILDDVDTEKLYEILKERFG